jgi:Ni/Co efflux regulator RcnB
MTMKTILSTLVALSVLAGVAASTAQAAEFGSSDFWIERDRYAP